jgi:hypothetical protein
MAKSVLTTPRAALQMNRYGLVLGLLLLDAGCRQSVAAMPSPSPLVGEAPRSNDPQITSASVACNATDLERLDCVDARDHEILERWVTTSVVEHDTVHHALASITVTAFAHGDAELLLAQWELEAVRDEDRTDAYPACRLVRVIRPGAPAEERGTCGDGEHRPWPRHAIADVTGDGRPDVLLWTTWRYSPVSNDLEVLISEERPWTARAIPNPCDEGDPTHSIEGLTIVIACQVVDEPRAAKTYAFAWNGHDFVGP